MNKAINGSNTQNIFYFKENIDKEKLISKIVTNIESKIKLVEEYKNKYYIPNKELENIIIGKYDFLEIINEFEEIITQSLQGMKSLLVEIRNLKEKKEIEEKIFNKRNKISKNKSIANDLNNLCYDYSKDKNYSQYLEESISNDAKNKINNNRLNEKNKSYCESYGASLYANMYGDKNNLNLKNNKANGTKNQLYFKKSVNSSLKNIPIFSIKSNFSDNNEISGLGSKNSIEDLAKIYNNRNINFNHYKTYSKLKKTISNDSGTEKNFLTYNLSQANDMKKENQNESLSIINNNESTNKINEPKINTNRRILRLQLKNKSYNNINDIQNKNKNNSFTQKYELELKNTGEEKNEKIEVEIKCPLRLGIRQNIRKNIDKNENLSEDIINIFNYNRNKKDIIQKIISNEKLRNYFSKKYGANQFDLFLNKFWNDKLGVDDINNEVKLISAVFQKEEKNYKIKNKGKKTIEEYALNLGSKKNNKKYNIKINSREQMQNFIVKNKNKGNKNYRTITPSRNLDNKYFNHINILN